MSSLQPSSDEVRAEQRRRAAFRELGKRHPANLLGFVKCIDAKSGERFVFHLDEGHDGSHPWFWQREVLDWWIGNLQTLVLKARQLGITWLACGLALWVLLSRPGSRVLAVSINQDEATKLVCRVWDMYWSLPVWLRYGTTVLKPTKGARPTKEIQLEHADGRISTIIALPSTETAGHGETAALVILDEFSRQEHAEETWKAVVPTTADTAKARTRILVISTANGVSNEKTGEGNRFHHLWVNSGLLYKNLETKFLGWRTHPDRTQEWYDDLSLPAHDKAEQYPDTPEEAFVISGRLYFDKDAIFWYSKNAKVRSQYDFTFVPGSKPDRAKIKKGNGLISVYQEPLGDHEYAIAADVATGRGLDYSAAYVIDLSSMALCAELHGKLGADELAYQLHFLGRWFNTARIAVEMGGGYGEPVIISLHDGKFGRPPYPKLYRYTEGDRSDVPKRKGWGFPMTQKTRPLVLSGLEKALREHSLPWVTAALVAELSTFVHKGNMPSPRAEDGTNDDLVFAAAIAVELYRQFGQHPLRVKKPLSKRRFKYLTTA